MVEHKTNWLLKEIGFYTHFILAKSEKIVKIVAIITKRHLTKILKIPEFTSIGKTDVMTNLIKHYIPFFRWSLTTEWLEVEPEKTHLYWRRRERAI